jgi:aryl-alcohol dehydrogenase-like predicted oxidoreductase
MALDHYVTLGKSGLRVSPFALGTMTFGEDWGWGSSVADSDAILTEYLERGGNFIDTANVYTSGHSEKILGDYFAARPGKRARIVLSTKFFGNLHLGDPNGGGAGRKSIVAQLEDSLRRLQTDYVDVYWFHNWDRLTPIEETLRTLDDIVRSGKVRYIGLSDIPAWKVAQAQIIASFRGFSPAIALQVEYSLLERTVEGELIPAATELGLGVMPWSPLKSGFLSGKFTRTSSADSTRTGLVGTPSERDFAIIDVLERVAKEVDASVAQTALAWVQGRPGVTSTLIGARSLTQLGDNLKALDVTLSPEQRAKLDDASKPTLNFPAENNALLAPTFQLGGTQIDGLKAPALPALVNSQRY